MTTDTNGAGGLPELPEPFAFINKTNGFSYAGNSTFFQWCLDLQRSGQNAWPEDATFLYTAEQARAYGDLCRATREGDGEGEALSIIDKWMDNYDHVGTGDRASARISEKEWEDDRRRLVAILRTLSRVAVQEGE